MLNLAYLAIILLGSSLSAEGEGSLRVPRALENIDIIDKAGQQIHLDILLTDQDGRAMRLADYFSGDKRPVILTMGYYGCPMLCNLVLNGLIKGLDNLSFKLGQDYRIISVSIDEREQPDLAKKKQAAYLNALSSQAIKIKDQRSDYNYADWIFHVGRAGETKKLAEDLGFKYYFDNKNKQFAHGAGIFVLSPTGVLSRTLFGIEFKPSDLKLALSEAADGKIGSFIDRVILSCFHYDPDSHRYGVYILGVMRLGGILTVLFLGLFLLSYFRAERKRNLSMV